MTYETPGGVGAVLVIVGLSVAAGRSERIAPG